MFVTWRGLSAVLAWLAICAGLWAIVLWSMGVPLGMAIGPGKYDRQCDGLAGNGFSVQTTRHLFTWGDMWKSYWWGWFIGALSSALTVHGMMHHG